MRIGTPASNLGLGPPRHTIIPRPEPLINHVPGLGAENLRAKTPVVTRLPTKSSLGHVDLFLCWLENLPVGRLRSLRKELRSDLSSRKSEPSRYIRYSIYTYSPPGCSVHDIAVKGCWYVQNRTWLPCGPTRYLALTVEPRWGNTVWPLDAVQASGTERSLNFSYTAQHWNGKRLLARLAFQLHVLELIPLPPFPCHTAPSLASLVLTFCSAMTTTTIRGPATAMGRSFPYLHLNRDQATVRTRRLARVKRVAGFPASSDMTFLTALMLPRMDEVHCNSAEMRWRIGAEKICVYI